MGIFKTIIGIVESVVLSNSIVQYFVGEDNGSVLVSYTDRDPFLSYAFYPDSPVSGAYISNDNLEQSLVVNNIATQPDYLDDLDPVNTLILTEIHELSHWADDNVVEDDHAEEWDEFLVDTVIEP